MIQTVTTVSEECISIKNRFKQLRGGGVILDREKRRNHCQVIELKKPNVKNIIKKQVSTKSQSTFSNSDKIYLKTGKITLLHQVTKELFLQQKTSPHISKYVYNSQSGQYFGVFSPLSYMLSLAKKVHVPILQSLLFDRTRDQILNSQTWPD